MAAEIPELVSLAQSLRQQGRFADARVTAERVIAIDPDNAAAWFNLAAALGALGELRSAEAAYRRALQTNPHYAEAWSNLAGLLGATGRSEEQLAAYRRAVDANPQLAPIWSNLGNALCNARRFGEAERACRRAVELDARFAPGWLNLGRALHEAKRHAEARTACERALEVAPQLPDAWAGYGNALMGAREFSAAIEAYRKAIALNPQSAHCHANLGIALQRVGAESEGLASLRTALQLDPSHDFASWNLGMFLLERGALAEGWARYEARWTRPDAPPRRFAMKGAVEPQVSASFKGRTLLWGEQGVGDHILYARMAWEAAQAGAAVTLETDARLVELFRRSFPGVTVVAQVDPPQVDPAQFEHVLPLASVGCLLRPSFEAFPRHAGYLVADARRTASYREALEQQAPRHALIVGIAWRSSNPELGNEKSAPLSQWGELFAVPGIAFVSLQYGDVAEERRETERRFGIKIATPPGLDVFTDLDGLAALQAACDLVITTSTVNAHLAGALGQHAWVLLPGRIGTLWYWFQERADSPWYPTLTLIRQPQDGEWRGAMQLAARGLRESSRRRS